MFVQLFVGHYTSCPGSPNGFTRRTQVQYAGTPYTDTGNHIVGLPTLKTVDAGGAVVAETHYGYDETGVSDALNIVGHDGNYGTGFRVGRGNLTNPATCLNPSNCTWINHASTYDIAGNVTGSQDGNSNPTVFAYNDDNANKYAFPTSITNAAGQKTLIQYDYGAGKPILVTDANQVKTSYSYSIGQNGPADPLDRLTLVARAVGTALEAHTSFSYPNATTVVSVQDQSTTSALKTQTLYDGLGRAVESDAFEGGSQYIATTQSYDALGRVASSTNPSRQGDGLGYPTTYHYDALGRATWMQTADGAVTTNSYGGYYTTITDPAGKGRVTQTDALGRLTNVWEDQGGFNYRTDYTYDVLDDLLTVNQWQNQVPQTRTFVYDSLGRLQQATNPESGVTNYTYDGASNLATKRDGRNITTTYTFDVLNRLLTKTYSDGQTPMVQYTYDQGGASALALGQLTQVSAAGVSTTTYGGFDFLGRVTTSSQAVGAQTYSFAYAYNLAGALTSETYPSGRVVTNSYDAANRTSQVSGVLGAQTTNYVWGASYAPHGPTKGYWYGGNVARIDTYNSRLQHTDMWDAVNDVPNGGLLYLAPIWGTTNNNGTLQETKTYVGNQVPQSAMTEFDQNFTYDHVNRLFTAGETLGGNTTWSQAYSYDRWGNMTMAGDMVSPNVPTGFDGNNRVTGQSYDNAGNQLTLGPYTLVYDAENRQTSETNTISHPPASYAYDGNGQRLKRNVGSVTTIYAYDAFGQMAAEYSSGAAVTPACQTCYLSYDHLGTPRMVTDSSARVIARHDYLPFGQEVPGNNYGRDSSFGAADNINQKFTGQERDAETQFDFFQARYFGMAQGRFNSPDPMNIGANLLNPQSWNGYSYVLSSPLANLDPSGHSCITLTNDKGDQFAGDDGDGLGCAGAGVAPYNPDDLSRGLNQGQVNAQVTAQQGSWLAYIWATTTNQIPIYVPNDQPLSNNARQILSQVYQNTWPITKPFCSGGAFVFAGGGIGPTKLHAEAYAIPIQYESANGFSSGAIAEIGVPKTPLAFGGEVSVSWSTGRWSGDGLAFANKDAASAKLGPVSAGLLADSSGNVGAYAGGAIGIGVYGRPSFINGCAGN